MRERGHAAVELAVGVGVLLLPVALAVLAFGPWSERRVLAESAAAEGARVLAVDLDHAEAESMVWRMTDAHGVERDLVRLGWCGADPMTVGSGSCPLERGAVVVLEVEVWTPLVMTPWGEVGGLWVSADHAEPIDIYRSLP